MYVPLTSLILPKRQNFFFSSRRSILSSETISDDAVKTGYILFETLILILVVRKNNDWGVTSLTHCLSIDKVFKLKLLSLKQIKSHCFGWYLILISSQIFFLFAILI